MSQPLGDEIHAHLRAADRALAMSTGGSSELAHAREALRSLLVAMHALAALLTPHETPTEAAPPPAACAAPTPQRRRPQP
ncbi:MAG TPA: hypothetical protein PLJ35_15215 [Anaerolineae bacterium]|nr:hypothetical protein [Anaerolineae bacterium]HOR00162.1 hypothetical protein [Anaerolineae bacterium]HPL27450.1 hypothetical protein [Anaerolineae bacterium]